MPNYLKDFCKVQVSGWNGNTVITLVSQNPRSVEWFGLEGTLEIIWFQPPAMVEDTFR